VIHVLLFVLHQLAVRHPAVTQVVVLLAAVSALMLLRHQPKQPPLLR
jgi:hypothetical protein